MTLTAHPDKDVLMMFGGEYFDGSRVCLGFTDFSELSDDLFRLLIITLTNRPVS